MEYALANQRYLGGVPNFLVRNVAYRPGVKVLVAIAKYGFATRCAPAVKRTATELKIVC